MRYSRRRNNVAIAALVLCLALAGAIMVFALKQMPGTGTEEASAGNAASAEQRYTGTIVIPDGGACRRMEFDNATGVLRPAASGPCDDDERAVNSTQGRIDAIRGAFQKH